MALRRAVLVPGTWSYRGRLGLDGDPLPPDWFHAAHPFSRVISEYGFDPRVFCWDSEAGGIGFADDTQGWRAWGLMLYEFCVPTLCPQYRIPPDELVVICHSHGLQIVAAAAAAGLKIDGLVSIGSPVRKDMLATCARAKRNIRRWVHVYSDSSDRFQWIGALFDGRIGVYREHPCADVNLKIPSVGHSEILRDPQHFHHWATILAALYPTTLVAAVSSAPGPDGHP